MEADQSPIPPSSSQLKLIYDLSPEQKQLSRKIISNYVSGINTLVYAVCGAGKTELSYGVIKYALSKGQHVGFALPRRDVVIELYWRIKEAFPQNKVVAVYGGHTSDLNGDIIVLTTHQIYRYPDYFDLLVMDEIDAFPFKGNDILERFFRKSIKGHYVLMSATPSEEVINEFKKPGHGIVELRTRFHKKPIPTPKTVKRPKVLQVPYVIKKLMEYEKESKPCLVFYPTISECEDAHKIISMFLKDGNYVHSKSNTREQTISRFKKGQYRFLLTTSVLERGVTIKNLQVIVCHSDQENIYDKNTLIQIAGRAGRKYDAPDGEVIFVGSKETKSMVDAKNEIEFCNTFL